MSAYDVIDVLAAIHNIDVRIWPNLKILEGVKQTGKLGIKCSAKKTQLFHLDYKHSRNDNHGIFFLCKKYRNSHNYAI